MKGKISGYAWTLAGFIVVLVLAIVGIIYGLTGRGSLDNGFLGANIENATAVYCEPIGEDCPELRWQPEQIPVDIAPLNADADDLRLLRDVVRHVNGRLGFRMLRVVEQSADVQVRFRVPIDADRVEKGRLGFCQHFVTSGSMHGLVSVHYTPMPDAAFELLLHELGHCALLLAHDDTRQSVMYPETRANGRVSLDTYWITDGDRRRLRDRYEERR